MYFEQKFSVNPSNLKMTRSDYDYEMIENCLSIDNPSSSQTLIKLDTPRRSKRFRDALSTLPVQANYQQKVSRRNERERNRVQLINKEFEKLADLVYNINLTEVSTRNLALNDKENVRQQQSDAKRRRQFSKLNTLRNAIGYIKNLQCELLNSDPSQQNSFDFNSKEYDFTEVSESIYMANITHCECKSEVSDSCSFNADLFDEDFNFNYDLFSM